MTNLLILETLFRLYFSLVNSLNKQAVKNLRIEKSLTKISKLENKRLYVRIKLFIYKKGILE